MGTAVSRAHRVHLLALRNVESAHLADPRTFDFTGLDADRAHIPE